MEAINSTNPNQTIAASNNVYGKLKETIKVGNIDQKIEQKTTKTVIDGGKLIVEQYDRHGRLIRKTPPGYLPPGEKI